MNKVFNSQSHSRLDSDSRYKLIPPSSVLDKMQIKAGDTVVDIGAGTGFFALPTLDYVTAQGRVIATDLSENMLEAFKQKLNEVPKNLDLLLTDAHKINLPDEVADKILLAFLFHEITERPAFIAELKRLLKNGGELTIVDWALNCSEIGPQQDHRIGREEVTSLFKSSGFTLLDSLELNDEHYLVRLKL